MGEKASLRPLVEAFLWPLLFFETCEDDTLDPDIAIRQVEDIASSLQTLDHADRKRVVLILEQIADEVMEARTRRLILDLPKSIGWTDEDEEGVPR